MLTSICFGQKDATKFLGIPVDGTKSTMIQKLKEKGYIYNVQTDCLEGEFNGRDVTINIVTNNNKVYRIMVMDAHGSSEAQIKIRYNNLCHQFENNKKYMPIAPIDDFIIPDGENISFELSVHKKSYQAVFAQLQLEEEFLEGMNEYAKTKVPKEEYEQLSETEKLHLFKLLSEDYLKKVGAMKIVWFTIGEIYGDYYICIYYDNLYNQANGEDL